MNLYRATCRSGFPNHICRVSRLLSGQPVSGRGFSCFNSVSQNPYRSFLDGSESYKSKLPSWGSFRSLNEENLSRKLASTGLKQNLYSPSCLSFQRFAHFGNAEQGEASRPMDYVRGIMEEGGNFRFGRFQESNNEQNADILRITMLRNNTFVAITDSKGQKKPGVCASAGTLPDKGGKDSRISAEAACEHVGREAKKAGVKTVVVKVSGFTHFKRKRQAIMAFREGYTYGRGDQTPIICIEDKTRQPHNGCRKPKKRRI